MNTPKSSPVILLVDDDPAILLTVGDRLRSEGFTVVLSSSGEDAWGCVALHPVDLVVLDISIPGLGGLGFLRKAAQHTHYADIPVLVFTARTNMRDFFDTTGTAGFVPKTAAPEHLISAVRDILARQNETGSPKAPSTFTRKILVVEDDDDARHHLLRLFKRHGLDPHPVANPADIHEAIATHKPHAILLKYLLPRVNGPSIARMLGDSHATRQIPIVLYDDSGLHHHTDAPLTNVAKFIPSPNDGDFIKTITHVLSAVN